MGRLEQYGSAWRIKSRESDAYGILVQRDGYWWLLCPATATLYIDRSAVLSDCHDPACEFHDIHNQTAEFIRGWS